MNPVLNAMIAAPAFRLLGSFLSPGGYHARLSILIYHRVVGQVDPMFPRLPTSTVFERQMIALSGCFNVLSLGEAVRRLRARSLPARAVCVTFDDGYADNAEIALPILRQHGIPATFFIATGFLNGGRMWNDTVLEVIRHAPGPEVDLAAIGLGCHAIRELTQRRQLFQSLVASLKYLPHNERREMVQRMAEISSSRLPDDLMMTSAQVRKLHEAGMEIGGHTSSHPILARLDAQAAAAEIATGKEEFEAIIRTPVRLFAYPNGQPGEDYTSEQVEAVKRLGFEAALTTARGVATAASDLYQLPRFLPWDEVPEKYLFRLLQNLVRTRPATV